MDQLDKLHAGQSAIIIGFERDGNVTRRLMELGLVPGRKITLVRQAPLRDPVQLKVGSSRLFIRKAEASLVQVDTEKTAADQK
ncbi:MAG: ferrous iron transport protein A [candidate division Zixibacteria bacterium]|nr:ferrous iron transport protein A [candidate division Zixibacteria bacterium]